MTRYISLLRGINVTGHNMIPMSRLKAICESIGFSAVQTYIQSGNVIFRCRMRNSATVSTLLESALDKALHLRVPVITREPGDLQKTIRRSPYAARKGIDGNRIYIAFLKSRPAPARTKSLLTELPKTKDEFTIIGGEVHLYCPGGYGKTPLGNTFFERHLDVTATVRNWNTVNTLYTMCKAGGE